MPISNGFPKRGEMSAIIAETIKPITRRELIPVAQAAGRVCAQDVFAANTLPNTPTSRFDGIGVRYADFAGGAPDTSAWREGEQYVYSNTGIAMAEGFDTVIPIEEVVAEGGMIKLTALPEREGENVNAVGCDMREGELLVAEGTVITAGMVGLLLSGGAGEIWVYAKPRIAIIPTGSELVPPTANLPQGRNIESNSYMIAAYIEQWGALPQRFPITGDDPAAIQSAVKQALADSDMAVIIAGSSLGTADYTVKVLGGMGEIIVPELAHGPGRKSSLTMVGKKPVLGVAGPPMGAQITCDLYLSSIVSALRGLPHAGFRRVTAITDDAFMQHEVDFCERVHVYSSGGELRLHALFRHKTSRAQMAALANATYYRPAGTSHQTGDTVEVELMCPPEWLPEGDRYYKGVLA